MVWALVRGLVVVVALSIAGTGAGCAPAAAAAPILARSAALEVLVQEAPGTGPTTLPILPEGAGDPIQRPNSGVAPDDPGDRGGWQQVLVLCLLGGGLVAVGALAGRDIRRKRAARGR